MAHCCLVSTSKMSLFDMSRIMLGIVWPVSSPKQLSFSGTLRESKLKSESEDAVITGYSYVVIIEKTTEL